MSWKSASWVPSPTLPLCIGGNLIRQHRFLWSVCFLLSSHPPYSISLMIIFVEVEARDQDFQSFDAQLDSGLCFMCHSVPLGPAFKGELSTITQSGWLTGPMDLQVKMYLCNSKNRQESSVKTFFNVWLNTNQLRVKISVAKLICTKWSSPTAA